LASHDLRDLVRALRVERRVVELGVDLRGLGFGPLDFALDALELALLLVGELGPFRRATALGLLRLRIGSRLKVSGSRRALLSLVAVVARINSRLALTFEREDLGCDAIEEIAIMADD